MLADFICRRCSEIKVESLHLLHEAGPASAPWISYIQVCLHFLLYRQHSVAGGVQISTRNRNYPPYLTFSEIQITTQQRGRFSLCVTRAWKLLMAWSIRMRFENLCFAIAKTRQKLHVHTRAFAFILSVNIAKIESFQSIIRRLDLIYVIYCSKP